VRLLQERRLERVIGDGLDTLVDHTSHVLSLFVNNDKLQELQN